MATSHSAAAPAGGSGDYLVLITATVGNFLSESAIGCSLINAGSTPSSSGLTLKVYYKVAAGAGTETITVTTGDPASFAYLIYRVSGITNVISQNTNTSGGDPAPPSLTVSDLSVDHLYLAATSWDGTDTVVAYPYPDDQKYDYAGSDLGVACCTDQIAGSPVTPPAYVLSGSGTNWTATTIGLAGSAPAHDTPLNPDSSDGSGSAYPEKNTTLGPDGSNGTGTFTPTGGRLPPDISSGTGYVFPIPGTTTTLGPDISSGTAYASPPETILAADISSGSGYATEICQIVKVWDPGSSSWRVAPVRAYVSGSWQLATKIKFSRGGSWIGCS